MSFTKRLILIVFIFVNSIALNLSAQVFAPFSFWRPQASSYVLAYTVASGTAGNQGWGGSLGMEFNVGTSPITVYKVGYFAPGNAIPPPATTITVSIYERVSQTMVAGTQLTFTNAWPGTQEAGYAIFTATLSPAVSLAANGQYCIVAYGYNGGYNNGNGSGANFSSTNTGGGRVTFVGSARYSAGTGYPTNVDGGGVGRYGAGTFYFQ